MKALIHENLVKFLLNDSDIVSKSGAGIKIKIADPEPDMVVNDIPFADIEIVKNVDPASFPKFYGGKYQYTDGKFSEVEIVVSENLPE